MDMKRRDEQCRFMKSATGRALLGLFAGGAACGAAQAERPQYGAFMDIRQVVEGQLHGPGEDDVTYTDISANLSAQISNRRIIASGTYRLSYRLPEAGEIDRSLNQDGVMRIQATVIDEWLSVDGGGIVTRSRVDPSGAAPASNVGNPKNLAQTYSAFVEPRLVHRFGQVGFSANYRYAYTQNESTQTDTGSTGPLTDRFDSSVAQQLSMGLGMQRGDLPFDWQLSGEYRHENSTNLAQHLRSINGNAQITWPLGSSAIALVGSGGYERQRTSQRRALIDPLTGVPVVGKGGKFIVDPASPRILTYEMDGLIGNVGVIWRPSQRTRLDARVGYRYGGLSVTASLEMRPSKRSGLSFDLSDTLETFGQGVSGGLASSGPDLDLGESSDPNSPFQGCLIGQQAGSGSCLGNALGQAASRSYRERKASFIYSLQARIWSFGMGGGYSRRTYNDDPNAPVSLANVVDQNFFGNLSVSRRLTRTSGVSFSLSGSYFMNGQIGASDVMNGSFGANYDRSFGRGIQMQASVAVDGSKQKDVPTDISGRAQLGLQYKF
jgi:uncharacterized protein (PEP-CTERM system associated)